MRKFARHASRLIARVLPEHVVFNSITPVLQPFYHVISNQKLSYILNYSYRNTTQFEKELDYYLKYFKPVSLNYLVENPRPDKKVFHLSFDDGLRECYELIAPILLRKGIPATFFVNSGFINNKAIFHRYKASIILSELKARPNPEAELFLKYHDLDRKNILQADITFIDALNEVAKILGISYSEILKEQKPYLTTKQVISLKNQGFTIGAHGENHLEFWKISDEERVQEVQRSMNWVIEKINPEIKAFSFPFTDSGISRRLLNKLKFNDICDITFGTAGIKYDEYETHYQRYPVEQPGDFKLNLKSEFVYFKLRNALGKAIVKH